MADEVKKENNINKKWVPAPIKLAREETAARMAGYTGVKWVFYSLAHTLIGEILIFILLSYLIIYRMYAGVLVDILTFAQEAFDVDWESPTAFMIQCWTMILPLIAIIFYVVFMERRSAASMGFRHNWWILKYIGGVIYGFIAFSASLALILILCGGRVQIVENIDAAVPGVVLALIGFLIQGAAEEVAYRGFLFTTIARDHNLVFAALISAIAFGLAHINNPGVNLLAIVNISLMGIFWVLLFLRTESLWTCCAFHSVWNFVQGNFYGLAVSGLDAGSSVLNTQIRQGRDLFTGGEFGVEASVCTTVVIVVFIVIEAFLLSGKYRKYAEALEDEEEYQAFMRENGNNNLIAQDNNNNNNNLIPDGAEEKPQEIGQKPKVIKELALDDDIPDMPTGWTPAVIPEEISKTTPDNSPENKPENENYANDNMNDNADDQPENDGENNPENNNNPEEQEQEDLNKPVELEKKNNMSVLTPIGEDENLDDLDLNPDNNPVWDEENEHNTEDAAWEEESENVKL